MPPKGRGTSSRRTPRKATTAEGGDAELIERERDAAERSTVAARGVRLQPIDADGQPTGPAHVIGEATATIDVQPVEPVELPPLAPGATIEFSTDDPAGVEAARELLRIPLPTAVVAQWFPAYFRSPNEPQPWAVCKVFLTPQGLYVYRAAPEESETFTTGATPAWYSTVDFAKTAKPVTGYAAMNAGIPIETAAGRVNVQPYPGCGCGHRKLKNWTPSWSRNRISWDDAVALTDTTAGR